MNILALVEPLPSPAVVTQAEIYLVKYYINYSVDTFYPLPIYNACLLMSAI